MLAYWLIVLGLVLMAMAYFLPNRPPMNDILAVAGVIAAAVGLVLLAVGGTIAVDVKDHHDDGMAVYSQL